MWTKILFAFLAIFLAGASPSLAHFGMVIPSRSTVMDKSEANVSAILAFAHPFAGQGMNLEKPAQVFLAGPGGRLDLAGSLKSTKFMDHAAWETAFQISRPGVWQLAMAPEPYFEEAEDCFIVHYTKTVIASFGNEDGWNEALGLPMEIVPLVRPFANYAGNLFGGTVLKNGKPLPGALVEVEFLNQGGKFEAPNAYFETQTLQSDQNGNFFFTVPWAGWWGFAALSEGEAPIEKDGQAKQVETGAVIWLEFTQPVTK